MSNLDLVVIGGGAAGFFCAINYGEKNPGARILLVEATQKLLTKVRISGGGRCNVTHNCFVPAELVKNYPRGSRELRGSFEYFQPSHTVEWFARRGVILKAEADGRMFPITDSSETIVNCFMDAAASHGIKIVKGQSIVGISKRVEDGLFHLTAKSGEEYRSRFVLLATGSSSTGHDLAKSLGHSISTLSPSLFTFKVSDDRLTDLGGVSFKDCSLDLAVSSADNSSQKNELVQKFKFRGPVLITHWGLSGPAVLKLSAFAAHELFASGYVGQLTINFLGALSSEDADARIISFANDNSKKFVLKNSPFTEFTQRWWERLCTVCGVSEETKYAELSKKVRRLLVNESVAGIYKVSGKGIFKEEFVTAGGVNRIEVDFRTMESKTVEGLYFAGEVMDLDGITGGFNFQNAWTNAFLASQDMIKKS